MKFDFTDSKNIGKEYKDFILLSIDDIPDYKTKGVFLRHKKTGLELYHILKDDKENLFAFAFRTIAKDSKGTAHIIEHSTLGGSEKYPLKDPFGTLASQSISTFLNALTYPDKTVYPGASLIKNDYFNMMDVYADSVFFPRLDYKTFIQEGHRLELDQNDKLSIQGVVYNEMKANYSSFMSVAYNTLISNMFPNSYPSFDSGGDPVEIPTLEYEEFLDFHKKFYAPDNCILFLYGNIPTEEQIDFIQEKYIPRLEEKFGCKTVINNYDSKMPLIKPEVSNLLKLNKNLESKTIRTIAPKTGSTGNIVSMNWYSGTCNMEKYYLSEVLLGNDGSPLNKMLKDSKLGDDLFCGNFGQFKEEFFSLGFTGVKKDKEQKVYQVIKDSIYAIYNSGINKQDIESAVMGIDFNLREENRWWGPYSIQIMEKALKGWVWGESCSSQLTSISSFEKVKEKIKNDPDYTKNLIKKYFIDNHLVINFVCEPSDKYFENRNKAELDLINKKSINLDKEKLRKDLELLHEYQQKTETQEQLACIPYTKISELKEKIEVPKIDLQFIKGKDNSDIPLFVSQEETNGIFYIDVLFPFDNLHPKFYKYIPLLSMIITNLGWNNKAWDECITESACIMGDVWGRVLTGKMPDSIECQKLADKYKQYNIIDRKWLGIGCKALTSKSKETLDLLSQIISTMDFKDEKHFATLIKEIICDHKANYVQSGRDIALKRARCVLSENDALNEIMWGATQEFTLKQFKNYKKVLKQCASLYKQIISLGGIIHITSDKDSLKQILPQMQTFAKDSGITKLSLTKEWELKEYIANVYKPEHFLNSKKSEAIKMNSQTGYAVCVSPASKYLTKDAAAENVFASWFSMHTLWEKFRYTGGAYGAGTWADNCNKVFVMYTYRDPTPQNSSDVYLEALKEMCNTKIPEEDIERSIVSLYGDAIVPQTPKDRGRLVFEGLLYANYGFKPMRVQNILEVTQEDVQKVVKNLYEMAKNTNYNVVFCDKSIKYSGNILKLPL